jgi:serine/threonine protein kinase
MKRVYVDSIQDFQKKNSECFAMAKLEHPNMVRLISTSVEGEGREIKCINLFMDYYPEGDLEALIKVHTSRNQF